MRYGTFQEIAEMQLGVTGLQRTVNDVTFEMVKSDDAMGWTALGFDANGDVVQHDPLNERDAEQLGLIAKRFGHYDTEK